MIGIIPIGGHATRIHGLPKFLLPVPGGYLLNTLCLRMRDDDGTMPIIAAVSAENANLLQKHAPPHLRMTHVETATMCEALLVLQGLTGKQTVLFGMPDTYWSADNVYHRLAEELRDGADVAVACWRVRPDQIGKVGQVALDDGLLITQVVDKDPTCTFDYMWGAIAWDPEFWAHIRPDMQTVGDALQAAVLAGLEVCAVLVPGEYWDCGTPDEYFNCVVQIETRRGEE